MRLGVLVFLVACGGRLDDERDAGADAMIADVTIDAPDVGIDAPEAIDASSPSPPEDCGAAIIQPQALPDAKVCPYQQGGGTTCAYGDYCCEPADGGATCSDTYCGQGDFVLKCSGMNNGCFGGACCIPPSVHRVEGACAFFEGDETLGTFCSGGGSNNGPYCGSGSAQVCATSAECANGSTCEPLVLARDGGYPIWLGVCVASDGGVYAP